MGMRLKAGAGMIKGASANICCEGRKSACKVYGDPHCDTFDRKHNDYYVSGEFWIIKNDQVKVQARYLPTHITRGLSVTKEITIGGPFMQGHILRISSTSVLLDGSPILTSFPSHYSLAGVFTVTFNAHGKILQPHRELGKDLKVLHFHFEWHGIFMQVNQWTNEEEGHFVNLLVEMDALPNMDGHCGNFNGVADDTLDLINGRMELKVSKEELLFPKPNALADDAEPKVRELSVCAPGLRAKAEAQCKESLGPQAVGQVLEACVFDRCFGGEGFEA